MNREVRTSDGARTVSDDASRRILFASVSTHTAASKRRPDRRSRPIDFDIDEFTSETREIPATRDHAPLIPRLAPQCGEIEIKPTKPEPQDSDSN